mmetsp:Transcript_21304/g.52489  ORF Transcript_21304/g.52489 Transcript_21304/m.52489 type:complete len:277 (-) Transcript_21304:562-1392(-)
MLDVMLALRQTKYPSGESVKARVKSGVARNRDALTSPLAFYSPLPTDASVRSNTSRKNKKRKNGKSRNNKSVNSQNGSSAVNKGKNNTSGRRRGNGTKSKESEHKTNGKSTGKKGLSLQSPLLNLGGEQFPPLPNEFSQSSLNKVEVEKVPTHYQIGRKGIATSDASSTATVSTSSSKSPHLETAMGGYAAALRKAPAAAVSVKETPQDTPSQMNLQTETKKEKKACSATRDTRSHTESQLRMDMASDVDVKPPTWGHGSFAAILRTEETVQALNS